MVFDHKTCKFPVFRRFRFRPQPASAIFSPQKKAFLIRKLKARTKVGKPGEKCEIDEITISPYTKCVVAVFDRKFLSP